ncbi:hypothetical protein [Vibrio sp. C8]
MNGQVWVLARMMKLSDSPQATLAEKLSLPESCATLLTQYMSEMRDETVR